MKSAESSEPAQPANSQPPVPAIEVSEAPARYRPQRRERLRTFARLLRHVHSNDRGESSATGARMYRNPSASSNDVSGSLQSLLTKLLRDTEKETLKEVEPEETMCVPSLFFPFPLSPFPLSPSPFPLPSLLPLFTFPPGSPRTPFRPQPTNRHAQRLRLLLRGHSRQGRGQGLLPQLLPRVL